MKIVCQSCGKKYNSEQDELCPKCGSYNPFTRVGGQNRGSEDKVASYHERQRGVEATSSEKAKETVERLHQRTEELKERRERHTANTMWAPVKQQSSEDSRKYRHEEAEKEPSDPQNPVSVLSIVFRYAAFLAAFCMVAGTLSEMLGGVLQRLVFEESRADRMEVEQYEQGDSILLGNGVQLKVTGVQKIPLDSEKIQLLQRYDRLVPTGMELTAVLLEFENDAEEFLHYGEQAAYLRGNGVIYSQLDNWDVEQMMKNEYGIQPISNYYQTDLIDDQAGILFLTPQQEADAPAQYSLCIQELDKLPPVDVEAVEYLSVIDLQEER